VVVTSGSLLRELELELQAVSYLLCIAFLFSVLFNCTVTSFLITNVLSVFGI
jgi:hypothetical protein